MTSFGNRYQRPNTKRNPPGWRWRLVLWLTGGTIEAVPMFHCRDHTHQDTVVVSLGRPDRLNTAEMRYHRQ